MEWIYKKDKLPESGKEVIMYSKKHDEIFLGYENMFGVFTKSKNNVRTNRSCNE